MQTWSTASRTAGTPFGSWAEDLAQAFVRLEPTLLSDAPFTGRIKQAGAGPVRVSRVEASAHRVARLKEHIAGASDDTCFVNLQIEGTGLTRQRDRESLSRPLDLVVVDTAEPLRIEHQNQFALFSIAVPRELLPGSLGERRQLALSTTRLGREIGQTLINHARLVFRIDQEGLPPSSLFGSQLLDLIAYAATAGAGGAGEPVRASARLDAMRDYVARNLHDERLGAAMVAHVFGVSPRYVHMLFEPTGSSLSEHINRQRLLACAREIGRPQDHPDSISTIAFRYGYRDISYFNRRFKREFGETPSQYRRRHAAGTGAATAR